MVQDPDSWISTWARNGRWELLGQAPEGRDAVLEHWKTLMSGIPFVYQLAGEGSIEIEASGDRGTGRVPTIEFAKLGDGPGTLLLGTYHDVYVVEDGRWCFLSRRSRRSERLRLKRLAGSLRGRGGEFRSGSGCPTSRSRSVQ